METAKVVLSLEADCNDVMRFQDGTCRMQIVRRRVAIMSWFVRSVFVRRAKWLRVVAMTAAAAAMLTGTEGLSGVALGQDTPAAPTAPAAQAPATPAPSSPPTAQS